MGLGIYNTLLNASLFVGGAILVFAGYSIYVDAQTRRLRADGMRGDDLGSAAIGRFVLLNGEGAPGGEKNTASPTPVGTIGGKATQNDAKQTVLIPTARSDDGGLPMPGKGGAGLVDLPTPRQQGAGAKKFFEGHWRGMELLELTPTLAAIYNVPAQEKGLLVDEVTLQAAESGLLAGDVVFRVGEISVANLREFKDATFAYRDAHAVTLYIYRNGLATQVTLRAPEVLGIAQFEAASPIIPGAVSPHRDMGRPCTDCHIIMANGGQLAVDQGDVLPTPRPLTLADLSRPPPHGDRGICQNCHRMAQAATAVGFQPAP